MRTRYLLWERNHACRGLITDSLFGQTVTQWRNPHFSAATASCVWCNKRRRGLCRVPAQTGPLSVPALHSTNTHTLHIKSNKWQQDSVLLCPEYRLKADPVQMNSHIVRVLCITSPIIRVQSVCTYRIPYRNASILVGNLMFYMVLLSNKLWWAIFPIGTKTL